MSHAADLETFIYKQLGVPMVGTNDVNKGQCTGLVAVWCESQHKPIVYANAVDMIRDAPVTAYHVELNAAVNYPHAGDIICWNGNFGGGFGHTAIVVAANVNQLVVFEQNNPDGHPPIVATHDYSSVIGWISWH
jgi:surface antigen